MKKIIFVAMFGAAVVAGAQAKLVLSGSDTLAGAMTDVIIQAGLDQSISYVGGGSGVGEKNLLSGDQGIAPMSREVKADVMAALQAQGNSVVGHILGLDGISVVVNTGNSTPNLDVATVAKIFGCEVTRWEQIPGSGLKGDIHAFRRNNESGTTDAFKNFTGIKTFGACVTILAETADIADKTSRDVLAVGYSGLSGKVAGNREVAIAAKAGAAAVMPTTATIRSGSYPFARKLYVFEVTGSRKANDIEVMMLDFLTDRSFMDPIMQAHEFITVD